MPEIKPGWFYDPSDPSVGIFTDAWYHDCVDGNDVDVKVIVTVHTGQLGELRTYYLLTCLACVSQTIVFDHDWDPDIRPCDVEFGFDHEHDEGQCEFIMRSMQGDNYSEARPYDPRVSEAAMAAGERY